MHRVSSVKDSAAPAETPGPPGSASATTSTASAALARRLAPPPPTALSEAELRDQLTELRALAVAAGCRIEPWGECDGWPLFAATRRAASPSPGARHVGRPKPRIYLSAGIHGDEAAPTATMRELLRHGFFDDRAHWFLCPLLNPTGMRHGTRENAGGIDLNRDYRHGRARETRLHLRWLERQPRFDLVLCLHEDWESVGFYFYEVDQSGAPSLAPAVLAAAAAHGPLEDAAMIDERPTAAPGLIRPHLVPAERELWPEAVYLFAHHSPRCFTIETASVQPLAQRVATQCAVVRAAVEALLAQGETPREAVS